ncbi:MAG: hypothetical protein WCJ95_05795 [Mariniphaga sp.]
MYKIALSKLSVITIVLWITVYFSALALVYHIRWFIPFLLNGSMHFVVPPNEVPLVWFGTQISTNLIFLYVAWLLIRLIRKFKKSGFFDRGSLKALDGVIVSCLALALLGAVRIILNNLSELHLNDWTSAVSIVNLITRSFTRLLVFSAPQTIYLLLSIILWSVRQFVTTALAVKEENEKFI